MGILESVVLVLVIGFTVIITAYAIIQKIFDEGRKNSDLAMKQINKVFTDLPKIMLNVFNEIQKRDEEQRAKVKAERETLMKEADELLPY